jgi:hypothetical protein
MSGMSHINLLDFNHSHHPTLPLILLFLGNEIEARTALVKIE